MSGNAKRLLCEGEGSRYEILEGCGFCPVCGGHIVAGVQDPLRVVPPHYDRREETPDEIIRNLLGEELIAGGYDE